MSGHYHTVSIAGDCQSVACSVASYTPQSNNTGESDNDNMAQLRARKE
jgi:hypothetical protein